MSRPLLVKLIASLDALWTRKRPALQWELRPGAKPAKLDACADRSGLKLPPAFRCLYQWHDGFRDEHCALEGFFGWCSLVSLQKHKKTLDQMERKGFFDEWDAGSWWNLSWIPFLQFNLEDHVCLDLGGTLGKGRGAVFIRRNSDSRRTVIASSFHSWLHAHVELTAAGPDDVDEDSWIDYFGSRSAARIRRAIDPAYPVTVEAKRPSRRR